MQYTFARTAENDSSKPTGENRLTTSKKQTEALIMAGLNLIQPALSIYDQDLQLAACNHRFKAVSYTHLTLPTTPYV